MRLVLLLVVTDEIVFCMFIHSLCSISPMPLSLMTMSLVETIRKLRISFFEYEAEGISERRNIPPLPIIIEKKSSLYF